MMGHCGTTRRKMFTEKSTTRGKTDKMIPQQTKGINGKVKKWNSIWYSTHNGREKKENRNDSKEKEKKERGSCAFHFTWPTFWLFQGPPPLLCISLPICYFPLNNGIKSTSGCRKAQLNFNSVRGEFERIKTNEEDSTTTFLARVFLLALVDLTLRILCGESRSCYIALWPASLIFYFCVIYFFFKFRGKIRDERQKSFSATRNNEAICY